MARIHKLNILSLQFKSIPLFFKGFMQFNSTNCFLKHVFDNLFCRTLDVNTLPLEKEPAQYARRNIRQYQQEKVEVKVSTKSFCTKTDAEENQGINKPNG